MTKPVYALKDGKFVQVGKEGDPEFAKIYWACKGDCTRGEHIVLMFGILKQVHCPICEPDWDWEHDWRHIWDQPSESCPASHERPT